MGTSWLDDFVTAWILHPHAGSAEGARSLSDLLAFMSPTVRYEDVPTKQVLLGHAGVEDMCKRAYEWSADLEFRVLTSQSNGSMYAFEHEGSGTNTTALGSLPATGRHFVIRGVSVGTISAGGLVEEHRDYWDLASFLEQIGALPTLG